MSGQNTGHSGQAFTLVELLTVVSIIALLVGILLPGLSMARAAANRAACRGNLHAVGVAFQMYLNGNNEIMPIAAQMPSVDTAHPGIGTVLAKEIENPKVLCCPGDKTGYFTREGTSYEYPEYMCGRYIDQNTAKSSLLPVMYDYTTFHGKRGKPGCINYLFIDGHVGDIE